MSAAELDREIAIPAQRYEDDRRHLADERDTARQIGDLDGVDAAEAHLEVLEAEQRLAQRGHLELGDEDWEREW